MTPPLASDFLAVAGLSLLLWSCIYVGLCRFDTPESDNEEATSSRHLLSAAVGGVLALVSLAAWLWIPTDEIPTEAVVSPVRAGMIVLFALLSVAGWGVLLTTGARRLWLLGGVVVTLGVLLTAVALRPRAGLLAALPGPVVIGLWVALSRRVRGDAPQTTAASAATREPFIACLSAALLFATLVVAVRDALSMGFTADPGAVSRGESGPVAWLPLVGVSLALLMPIPLVLRAARDAERDTSPEQAA